MLIDPKSFRFRHEFILRGAPVAAGLLAVLSVGHSQTTPESAVAGLKWRNIGPFRAGRVSAVAGVISEPATFYMGTPQGGVWKTTSAGTVWNPVFDGVKDQSSIGSIAVAQSNPNVVYAGTGEISGGATGDGAYRSTDAGASWTKIGLEGTSILPTLLVDPKNENLVIAAATGSSGEADDKRGVYRSVDGGRSWSKTLNVGPTRGIQHLAWAYDNPSVILATSSVRFYGKPPAGTKAASNPELYKSIDEGLTWTKLSPTGLPKLTGRITTAIAQGTNSQRIFLIGTFGLYRSDDGGQNWRQMAADDPRIVNGQGEYSCGVYVDAYNPDLVYTLATSMYRSIDGGKTFSAFKDAPGGDDPQQLWVDPVNKGHILYGCDQGASVSLDQGTTWTPWYNQITGQVYHVAADNRFPYWIYSTEQDSGSIALASAGALGQITQFDWYPHPGSEAGWIVPDPINPSIVYGSGFYGGITRVTMPSYQSIQVEPPAGMTGPGSGQFMFSPANPHELLTSTKAMLSTTDGGIHWKSLSPDLASANKKDDQYAAIRYFSPSPLSADIIWVQTSTNLVQLTSDHGRTWTNVTPPVGSGQKPLNLYCLEASGTRRSGAYAVCEDPNEKDLKQHIKFYRTVDFGKTWNANPTYNCSNIRSDPKAKGLLFMQGSDQLRYTVDDGETWKDLDLNLPKTSYTDLQIHGNDLILGTYGRGIWILDDYSPLRQISRVKLGSSPVLYQPATAIRMRANQNFDTALPPEVPHAPNPPLGASLFYDLPKKPGGAMTLDIFNQKGERVRHFTSIPPAPYDDPKRAFADYWLAPLNPLPTEIGLNRVNWDCRYDSPFALTNNADDTMQAVPGGVAIPTPGPLVAPGRFKAVLTVDGQTLTQIFEVANDPRSTVATHELGKVLELQKRYLVGAQEAVVGYHQTETLLAAIDQMLGQHPAKEVSDALNALRPKVLTLRGVALNRRRAYGPPEPDSFANLNVYMILQMDIFSYGDSPLTDLMLSTYGADWTKLSTLVATWSKFKKDDLAKLNGILKKNNLPAIAIPPELQNPTPPPAQFLPPNETKIK